MVKGGVYMRRMDSIDPDPVIVLENIEESVWGAFSKHIVLLPEGEIEVTMLAHQRTKL
jgi:hypothetical protein